MVGRFCQKLSHTLEHAQQLASELVVPICEAQKYRGSLGICRAVDADAVDGGGIA